MIHDISHPATSPKKKFFAEVGEEMINVDGAIELARRIDTPQAKAIYHAFRKRLAEYRTTRRELTPEKMREEAWFAALADLGFRVTLTPLAGTRE